MIGDKHGILRTQKSGFSLGRRAVKTSQRKCLARFRVRKMIKGTACVGRPGGIKCHGAFKNLQSIP